MSSAFSILIEMENLQQITTTNTVDFQQLSLHESARSWYLAFFDSWTSSVLSSQDTVNSTIITYFGYADHRYISGRRFESVTSLRKWYVRSYVYPLWQVLGMTIYDIVCVQQEGEIFWKLPFCQICRKGQHVVHGSEKKTHLNWLIFPQHFQDSFLSSLFHFILFYWACNWTFLSTLLHVWFLPAPWFYHSTFLTCLCRQVTRPSLPRSVEPRLCSACSSACLTYHTCHGFCTCITCLLIYRVSECE